MSSDDDLFRLMTERIKDYALITLDTQGTITTWNLGAQRIKGWRAEEIIGKPIEALYPPGVDPRRGLKIAAEQGSYEDYGWRMRSDGSRFFANVVITSLGDRGFAKITRDITERRHAEDALRNAYNELEAFTGAVSHDLRAPLRRIVGFGDELAEDYGTQFDDHVKDRLTRMRKAAMEMTTLIETLLDFSRAPHLSVKRHRVNLTDIAHEISGQLQQTAPQRNVVFNIASGMHSCADPALVRVVLDNLLNNAFKFTSHHTTAHIEVGSIDNAYFVKDDGVGFDMNDSERLFQTFNRLHPEFNGTGIGLATVKRIVERHGGSITVNAAPDEGAEFRFTLGQQSAGPC